MKAFLTNIGYTPNLIDSTINSRKQAMYNTLDVKSNKKKIKKGNSSINLSNTGKENIIQSYGLINMTPIINIDNWDFAKEVMLINYNRTRHQKMEIQPVTKFSIQDSKFNSNTYEFSIIENIPKEFKNIPKEFKNPIIIIKNIINEKQALKELNIMNNLNNLKQYKFNQFNLSEFYGIAFEYCNKLTLKYHLEEYNKKTDGIYNILFNDYDNCRKNILQLFEGVKYINNMDYIHNALNPNNILVHDNGLTGDTGNNRYILKITSFEVAEHVTKNKFPFKTDNISHYYLPHMYPKSVKLLKKSKDVKNVVSNTPDYSLYIEKNNDIWALGCIISEIYNVKKNLSLPPYNKTDVELINHLTKSWSSTTITSKLNDYQQNFKDLFMNKSGEIGGKSCGNLCKYLGFKLLINTPNNLNNLIDELKPDGNIDIKITSEHMEKIEKLLK